jgi:hypothetical protein
MARHARTSEKAEGKSYANKRVPSGYHDEVCHCAPGREKDFLQSSEAARTTLLPIHPGSRLAVANNDPCSHRKCGQSNQKAYTSVAINCTHCCCNEVAYSPGVAAWKRFT